MATVIARFGQSFRWRSIAGTARSAATLLVGCNLVLALVDCGIASQPQQTEQVQPASEAGIEALVRQLGSDDFQLRESAESELLKIGGPAIEPVRDAQASGNSEIRFRAYRLLPLLKRAETTARFQRFIDNGIAEPAEIFNAWIAFSRIAGNDKTARDLYATIHKASPQLFENLRSDPNLARVEYFKLINSLNRSQFRSLSAATVLFLDTVDFDRPPNTESGDTNKPVERIWTNAETLIRTGAYLRGQNAISFIETSGFENQFRLLIENWIDFLPSDDNHLLETKLRMIEAYRLIDRLPAIIEMAANETESIQCRAKAIAIVAKLGGPAEITALQPFLDNESTVGHFVGKRDQKQLLEVQLRDVALAACVFLSGQNLEDFGFVVNLHRKDSFLSLSRAGFFSEADREQAFQKWQQSYQDNPQRGK